MHAEAFRPNGHVTKQVYLLYAGMTLATMFGAWMALPAFLPSPREVLGAYPDLLSQGLVYQLYISLSTNLQAIALSCLLTVPLAYLTVMPAARPFVKVLCKFRFLSLTGLVVLFTIAFGGGHALKVALLTFGMGVFLVTSLYDIVEAIPREEFDHARTLRMGRWGSVIEVVVLGHFDAVLDTIRQNAAMGWTMVTMIEGLVRFEGGLGALMLAEDKHIRLAAVFAINFVVLAIGIAQDWALVWLRRVVCPYASLKLERQ